MTFETGRECRVESGWWHGAFTKQSVNDPSGLDTDHRVPGVVLKVHFVSEVRRLYQKSANPSIDRTRTETGLQRRNQGSGGFDACPN